MKLFVLLTALFVVPAVGAAQTAVADSTEQQLRSVMNSA
jgi:hypothetical protein